VLVDLDPVVAELVEEAEADGGGRHQVRIRLDAEADPRRPRLVRERPRALHEGTPLLLRLRITRERVQDRDAELLARLQYIREPPPAELLVQRRVAAHRDAAQAVAVEEPPHLV